MSTFVIVRSDRPWGEAEDWEIAGVFELPDVEQAKALVNERQGQRIDFSPEKGGKRNKMTERQTIERVQGRIGALNLPAPEAEYKERFKTYDLAWPDKQVAIEISLRKRPADTNGWTVGFVKPSMTDAQIDKILKALPLA